MLKIAGGKYRSRLIEVPEVVTVPTKNIVREALANALRCKIPSANVLDLFAGSGALGIEAISWGAKKAYFVDKSPEAAKIIRKNLLSLKIDNAEVINADFKDAISKIPSANVLDLFAGSGALGIEAISWGAKKAYFVDKSPEAAKIIRKNLLSLKIDNAEVINADFKDAISKIPAKIDVVFMDPPYKDVDFYQEGVSLLLSSSLLNDDAVIVLEYENEINIDETPFEEVRNYKYGRNKIKILWRKKS